MDTLGWDLTSASSAYATLAGVLAGFIFSAIGFVLYYSPKNRLTSTGGVTAVPADAEVAKRAENATLMWLVSAFFALLIASFLFAVISGESPFTTTLNHITLAVGIRRVRPLIMGIAASCLFSLAGLQVFLSLLWFFSLHPVDWIVKFTTVVGFYLLMFVTLVYIYSSFADVTQALTGNDPEANLPYWTAGAMSYGSASVVGIGLRSVPLLLALRRNRKSRQLKNAGKPAENAGKPAENAGKPAENAGKPAENAGKSPTVRQKFTKVLQSVPALLSLILTFVGAGIFGYIDDLPETQVRAWPTDQYLVVVVAIIGGFIFTYILSLPPLIGSAPRTLEEG